MSPTEQCYAVDMKIDHLAEFMFTKNTNNAQLQLSLGGIENTKDLFFFCLDIFCKGLVMLFGKGSNSVNVEDITMENFDTIREKMLCAGIDVRLSVYPADIDDEQPAQQPGINLDDINGNDNDLPLNEYEFKLTTPSMIYVISFNIVHSM
jgi:hypothetical protein